MAEIPKSDFPRPSPEDLKLYHQEFLHGCDLFQRALNEYQKSDIPQQKEAFKKVMGSALHVLNETASVVCNGKKQVSKEEEVEKDFKKFVHDDSEDNLQKLQADINDLKTWVTKNKV